MSQNKIPRSSGILLHPTSLPGPFGIGDLGPAAYIWVEALAKANQRFWQILPLGPTGYGDSPYQCFSAFAGNANLISPELLEREELLRAEDISPPQFLTERIEYGRVIPYKQKLLRHAYENFQHFSTGGIKSAYESFCHEKRVWLDDYALFMALKDARKGESWTTWPREFLLRDGNRQVLEFTRKELELEIGFYKFTQFLFFRQWQSLREHARRNGISIVGDIPIFVAPDSADVWANSRLFLLDGQLKPRVVAGVPPDYFSPTGQLWGNPVYDWDAMAENGYQWWIDRLRATFEMVDYVRLDHFRGFCAAWHVPVDHLTAEKGKWVPGPGEKLFHIFRDTFQDLPIIAEDLGEITPDVYQLRDNFQLPGMKVLQFAFDEPKNAFLPCNYTSPNCVVYTGTHDNDTNLGWYKTLPESGRKFLRTYLGHDSQDVSWDLIRMAWSSVADLAIVPFQDVLNLGHEARMNTPGKPDDNWQWRFHGMHLHSPAFERLSELTALYNRVPK
ncbi:4-alpha-glucanotransferase [Telmatocola sphagniphila]|uniref:4-alpha-glucanotransferase n=1 Tax=Telmatocola sphagniphila TaxID=1123043 RepID=A0A8E6B440_9BACT|nr:4-alpha-glucanotransferase [Telmatocola sphagniphila]QVL31527.1 4-alpha-glucanotransferase [Telmatocola sphagniphila]